MTCSRCALLLTARKYRFHRMLGKYTVVVIATYGDRALDENQ